MYRATDTNLKRTRRDQGLSKSVAGDAERLARFQREAQVLASLNHPKHCADPWPGGRGVKALVMELVEG